VIAPAHRDDDTAVNACLRCARHADCALRSTRPNRTRPANSLRYTDPRNPPIAVNAAAWPALGCIRVRIRTPAGPAATTGSPIRRSGLLIALILAHGTDTFGPNMALACDRAHSARFTPPDNYSLTHTFAHYHSVCRQQLPTPGDGSAELLVSAEAGQPRHVDAARFGPCATDVAGSTASSPRPSTSAIRSVYDRPS
jgi:hypothetical protein